jgi:hypothetical protein
MSDPGWQDPTRPPDPASQWGQQWGQQQPPTQWGQQPWQPQRSSGEATASLILGICGFLVCPLICHVLAVVFGYRAKREIDASNGTIGGRGLAVAGIILGWIGIALTVLVLILVVAVIAGDSSNGDFSAMTLR